MTTDPTAKWRTEGRIKIDATIFQGDSDAARAGWLEPGAGRIEWFKDHVAGPEMVVVPAGSFVMGSPQGEIGRWSKELLKKYDLAGAEDQHLVTLTRPIAVGRHAVTRGEFSEFVTATGHTTDGGAIVLRGERLEFDRNGSWRNPGFEQEDSHPVVCVGWEDAKAYAGWLVKQTGRTYRLLSEAEWEYVARAGTTSPFWFGNTITTDQANYNGSSVYSSNGVKGAYRKATLPSGDFEPNQWGLFQVHGNVWEWCEDVWQRTYDDAPADGTPNMQGGDRTRRVIRGGSWFHYPWLLRSARRLWSSTVGRGVCFGFRIARTLEYRNVFG